MKVEMKSKIKFRLIIVVYSLFVVFGVHVEAHISNGNNNKRIEVTFPEVNSYKCKNKNDSINNKINHFLLYDFKDRYLTFETINYVEAWITEQQNYFLEKCSEKYDKNQFDFLKTIDRLKELKNKINDKKKQLIFIKENNDIHFNICNNSLKESKKYFDHFINNTIENINETQQLISSDKKILLSCSIEYKYLEENYGYRYQRMYQNLSELFLSLERKKNDIVRLNAYKEQEIKQKTMDECKSFTRDLESYLSVVNEDYIKKSTDLKRIKNQIKYFIGRSDKYIKQCEEVNIHTVKKANESLKIALKYVDGSSFQNRQEIASYSNVKLENNVSSRLSNPFKKYLDKQKAKLQKIGEEKELTLADILDNYPNTYIKDKTHTIIVSENKIKGLKNLADKNDYKIPTYVWNIIEKVKDYDYIFQTYQVAEIHAKLELDKYIYLKFKDGSFIALTAKMFNSLSKNYLNSLVNKCSVLTKDNFIYKIDNEFKGLLNSDYKKDIQVCSKAQCFANVLKSLEMSNI